MIPGDAETANAPRVLTEQDELYLRGKNFNFTAEVDGDTILVILCDVEMPPGITPRHADVLLILPKGFPDVTPDCFWCAPDLTANGAVIQATEHHQSFAGREWQRWSRHFGGWRAGIDDLRTFVTLVDDCLLREGSVAA